VKRFKEGVHLGGKRFWLPSTFSTLPSNCSLASPTGSTASFDGALEQFRLFRYPILIYD
jgi:hypothetical protein